MDKTAQDIEALQAQIAGLALDLADTRLRAPFDGTVTALSFERGDVVAAGSPVRRLIDSDSAEARVGVPLLMALQARAGDAVTLLWRDQEISGPVRAVVPQITAASQTMLVTVEIPDAITPLECETVQPVLSLRVERDGFWVPLDALVSDLRGLFAAQIADPSDDSPHPIRRA